MVSHGLPTLLGIILDGYGDRMLHFIEKPIHMDDLGGHQVYHRHAWTYTMSIKGPGRDVSIRGTLKPLKRSAEEAGLPTGGPFTMVRDCDTMAAQIREDVRVAAAKQCEVQDTQEYDPQDTVLDEAALENPGTPASF